MSFQQFQRVNTPFNNDISDQWLTLENKTHIERSRSIKALDVSARLYVETKKASYALSEAYYLRRKFGRYSEMSWGFGRKKVNWTPHEKYWGTGIVNPQRGFSQIEMVEDGLIGAHFNYRKKKLSFNAFASPIYLPQVNPMMEVEDGKITSVNEWANIPANQASFNDVIVPIEYTLNKPKISELVSQPSFGANIGYAWSRNSGISFYTLIKPENQLRVSAGGEYRQVEEKAYVSATPFVNNHKVFGVNVGHTYKNFSAHTGLIFNQPEVKDESSFQTDFFKIQTNYDKEHYAHLTTALKYDHLTLGLNYITLVNNVNRTTDVFAKKPKWENTVGSFVNYRFNDKFKTNFDIKYDLTLADVIITNEFNYKFTKKIDWTLGYELIESPSTKSFWSIYRANDSLYTNINFKI